MDSGSENCIATDKIKKENPDEDIHVSLFYYFKLSGPRYAAWGTYWVFAKCENVYRNSSCWVCVLY